MRGLLQQNKRGVSEMVSYILLIVGALGLSILVYNYLKDFTPKGQTECGEEVSIAIRGYACTSSPEKLTISLHNNGKFNIPDFYVKIGKPNSQIRCPINEIDEGGKSFKPGAVYEFESTLDKVVISTKCNIEFFNANGKYILEIQPVIADKKSGHWAVCEDAIVTQEITCN